MLGAAASLVGCPDPAARFDEFESRIPDAKIVIVYDAPVVNEIPDVTGTALMALKISFVPAPIQVLVDWTLTKTGSTGKLSMTLRYLVVPTMADGTGRVPVGDPIVINNVDVDTTASFAINLGTLTIPAAANPLGNAATAEGVMLTGTIRNADSTCGMMTGMVTAPIMASLASSTFATVRAQPGQTGNQLPAPVNACP